MGLDDGFSHRARGQRQGPKAQPIAAGSAPANRRAEAGSARVLHFPQARPRPKAALVHLKVVPALGDDMMPAALMVRRPCGAVRTIAHQHLCPEVKAMIGGRLFAYFEAERVGDVLHLQAELPDLKW